MQYKAFKDLNLSRLGMGIMRLPTHPDGSIDDEKARELVVHAYRSGINYFDTAYSYHGGKSEAFIGKVLQEFPRDTWHLASKMPGHEIRPNLDPKAIFEEQLCRCQVDYFDFYLLHNVYEKSIEVYTDPKLGIVDYLREQKAEGRIRHLGFSSHATVPALREFLDRYDGVFEFVQIQLNYLDWILQDAKGKYELLTERNLPIIVMEPCRGGKLASLSPAEEVKLRSLRPNDSIASWAFRWLKSLPNVQVVLSGMSSIGQLQDNVQTFSDQSLLTDAEQQCLSEVADGMMNLLPCTGCRYCCNSCPQGLDIPHLLSLYSDAALGSVLTPSMTVDAMPVDKQPGSCIGCGNCRKVCPQGIDVPETLKKFQEILDSNPHWADISRERAEQEES